MSGGGDWDWTPEPRSRRPGAPRPSSAMGGRPYDNGNSNGYGQPGGNGNGRPDRRASPTNSAYGDGRRGQGGRREPPRAQGSGRDPRTAVVPPPDQIRRGGGPGAASEPAWDEPHQPQRMRGRAGPDGGGAPRRNPQGPPGRGHPGHRRPAPGGSGGPPYYGDDDPPVKRRRSWPQRLVLGIGIILVMGMLAGAGVAYYFLKKWQSIETFGEEVDTDTAAEGEPENFLLIGSDQRDAETPRSDTIMILRVDPETNEAQILSFQRDLMVEIAGTGEENKINSSFNSGAGGVVDTIRHNFGIPIHHVVEIDFQGFERLVDQVGGVELWIDAAVRDDDSGLFVDQLGCVNLNGEQALAFARSRKLEYMEDGEWVYDVSSDHGRVLRQQILIRQALSKAVHGSGLGDVNALLDIVIDTVTLSDELKNRDRLMELSGLMETFSTDGLMAYSMPIIEVGEAGSADLYPDWDTADPILNVFRGLPPDEVSPRRVTVNVQNGSGEAEQAANVAGALDQIGFGIGETGDAPAPSEATTIYHAPGEEAMANRVARHLDSGAQLAVDESLESGTVTLVTGADFTRLHEEPTPLEDSTSTTTAAPAGGATGESSATTAATTATTAAPADGGEGEGGTPSTGLPEPPERIGHAVGEPPPGTECGA